MNKTFFITILLLVCASVIAPAIHSTSSLPNLHGNWIFKKVMCQDAATVHYLTTLYEENEYNFLKDQTYTGSAFGFAVSGTWEVSADILVLNKDTSKEESYKFSLSSSEVLTFKTTEKGSEVFIQFVRA